MRVWWRFGDSGDSLHTRHVPGSTRVRKLGYVTAARCGVYKVLGPARAWRGYQPGPGEDMSVWARISALDWVTRHGWVTRAPAFHHLATNCQTVPIINSLSVVEKIKITASKALTWIKDIKIVESKWRKSYDDTQCLLFEFGIYFCCDLCLWLGELAHWVPLTNTGRGRSKSRLQTQTQNFVDSMRWK